MGRINKWCRQGGTRSGNPAPVNSPVLLPVTVDGLVASLGQTAVARATAAAAGVIEVEIGQARVRLRGAIDETSLLPAACCLLPAACCLLPAACCLLRALREAA